MKKRTLRIQSPAGHVHVIPFEDDGGKTIDISGFPEDEYGHWHPYWKPVVNGEAATVTVVNSFEDGDELS